MTAPLTVNEEEPFAPAVKLNPVVDARVSVPCETESVSESALVPAASSVIEMALLLAVEKLSELFSFRLPVGGAFAVGGETAPKPTRLASVGATTGVTAGWAGSVGVTLGVIAGVIPLVWSLPAPTTALKSIGPKAASNWAESSGVTSGVTAGWAGSVVVTLGVTAGVMAVVWPATVLANPLKPFGFTLAVTAG